MSLWSDILKIILPITYYGRLKYWSTLIITKTFWFVNEFDKSVIIISENFIFLIFLISPITLKNSSMVSISTQNYSYIPNVLLKICDLILYPLLKWTYCTQQKKKHPQMIHTSLNLNTSLFQYNFLRVHGTQFHRYLNIIPKYHIRHAKNI